MERAFETWLDSLEQKKQVASPVELSKLKSSTSKIAAIKNVNVAFGSKFVKKEKKKEVKKKRNEGDDLPLPRVSSMLSRVCIAKTKEIEDKIEEHVKLLRRSKKTHKPKEVPRKTGPSWCVGDFCNINQKETKNLILFKYIMNNRSMQLGTNLESILPSKHYSKIHDTVTVCDTCLRVYQPMNSDKQNNRKSPMKIKQLNKIPFSRMRELKERRKTRAEAKKSIATEKMPQITNNIENINQNIQERTDVLAKSVQKAIVQEQEIPQPEVVFLDAGDCFDYFSNEARKVSLENTIVKTLSGTKIVQLSMKIGKSNSIEDCRLVLRSLFLEVRSFCEHDEFFPDIPIIDQNAQLTLIPRHNLNCGVVTTPTTTMTNKT